jgi:branched-chain amino acid transport system substrate-binding protein
MPGIGGRLKSRSARRFRSPARCRRKARSSRWVTSSGWRARKARRHHVGGVKHKVKLVYSDYQSQTPRAVQLAEKLISSDKVNFPVLAVRLGRDQAASSVAEKYGVPMMASTASSKEVYDQNYKNLFGLYTPNDTLSEPIAALVKAKFPDVTRVAILARNDLYPLALGGEFKKSAEARACRCLFREIHHRHLDHCRRHHQIGRPSPTGSWRPATSTI